MPKPVCVPCKLFYRPAKNGIEWIEGYPVFGDNEGEWAAYRVWMGDKWKCRGCGHEIVVGHGQGPMSEKHHADFEEYTCHAELTINDC